jgi:urease accessory protein
VLKCDLLVVNKTDLAPHVGVDLEQMERDAAKARAGRPMVLTNCRAGQGIDAIVDQILASVLFR